MLDWLSFPLSPSAPFPSAVQLTSDSLQIHPFRLFPLPGSVVTPHLDHLSAASWTSWVLTPGGGCCAGPCVGPQAVDSSLTSFYIQSLSKSQPPCLNVHPESITPNPSLRGCPPLSWTTAGASEQLGSTRSGAGDTFAARVGCDSRAAASWKRREVRVELVTVPPKGDVVWST